MVEEWRMIKMWDWSRVFWKSLLLDRFSNQTINSVKVDCIMLLTWLNYLITFSTLSLSRYHPLHKPLECMKTRKLQQLRIKHYPYWSRFSQFSPEHQLLLVSTDNKSFIKLQNRFKRKLQDCLTLKK